MSYFLYFILAGSLAAALTPLVKRLAVKVRALDFPTSPRKIHHSPMPLLGGLAIFGAFVLTLIVYLLISKPNLQIIPMNFYYGILGGGLVLMLGGFLDDKFNLPPKFLWLFPAVAAVLILISGIGVGIPFISNPFGGPINLSFHILGLKASVIFVFFWLLGMVFTTKFLDGLDGLATGVGFIGALTMFFLSLTEKVNQPITATLAIILAGCCLGFLFYNFHPASIFLGEAGSTFIGFMLGVLAIILGAKIATALLVMGIPILDVAWVIVRRLWYRSSPFRADRKHLHFRLLDLGLTQTQTVMVLYSMSAIFGFTAIFLQSFGKLIALIVLFLSMIALALVLVMLYKRKHPHIPDLFDNAINSKQNDQAN